MPKRKYTYLYIKGTKGKEDVKNEMFEVGCGSVNDV